MKGLLIATIAICLCQLTVLAHAGAPFFYKFFLVLRRRNESVQTVDAT